MLPRPARPKPIRHGTKGTRTRAEIVAAAETHFATRGYEAARLEGSVCANRREPRSEGNKEKAPEEPASHRLSISREPPSRQLLRVGCGDGLN